MIAGGVETVTFNDDTSRTQSENLNRIVSWHNSQRRDYDVSIHFNAYQTTSAPRGTECLYVTQQTLAASMASGIASAGTLINRGAKKRTDLSFLNNTSMPAILIEVAFVDSRADADLYNANFEAICAAIASALGAEAVIPPPVDPPPTEPPIEPPVEPEAPAKEVVVSIEAPEGVEVSVTINGEPR
jgi:N-acetylmuramoyl-L-alanine amidase